MWCCQSPYSRWTVRLFAFCVGASACLAQTAPSTGAVRRLRGVIDKDQRWSGTIVLTDDVTVDGARITIAAGTIVEFAVSRQGHHPQLVVGGPASAGGGISIEATTDRPVVFRSRGETNAGRLVVHIRQRIVSGAGESPTEGAVADPARARGILAWRHVRFEGLGHRQKRRALDRDVSVATPAITFHVAGGGQHVSMTDCVFQTSTRVSILAADGSRVVLRNNRFEAPRERLDLEVAGVIGQPAPAMVTIADNHLTAGIDVAGAPVALTGNILIGKDAAIVVRDDTSSKTRIVGNYVHNTTRDDDGRYCLNCENPAAVIEDNVLRGGTTCVLNGSRSMSGNVLIAAPRLQSPLSKSAKTHQLVAALPGGARFERNLLLGPAYSLLIPQPRVAGRRARPEASNATIVSISHNLFDGFGATGRAILLDRSGRAAVAVRIINNVFLRCPAVVVSDGSKVGPMRLESAGNAATPRPRRPAEGAGGADRSGLAVVTDDMADLRLSATPPERLPDFDADILSGKVTVSELRRRLFEAYRPRSGSPLLRAGAGPDRPTIGPFDGPRD